ncbi:MAG: HIT domain-containing protein [Rhodobiaceae bacterium]|nr:HIT domain-containing protein [Rhodobiaceae bacterium]
MFELDARLAADTHVLAEWPLCRVLLMNDQRFPWLILVPRLVGLRDFHEVPADHRAQFQVEIDRASLSLQALTKAHKMNVAALGNMVPQLHVHVVARFDGDDAWPAPVWGLGKAAPYPGTEATQFIARFTEIDAKLHPEG